MRRQTIAVLLGGQAVAIAAWWTVLVIAPASRAHFHVHEPSLLAFWLADAATVVVTIAAAYAVWHARAWAGAALWAAAGATTYAALHCLALTLATGAAQLAALAMVPAAGLAIALAIRGTR